MRLQTCYALTYKCAQVKPAISTHTLRDLLHGNMGQKLISLSINFYIKLFFSHRRTVFLPFWHGHCYRHNPYLCLICYHGNILQLTNTLAQYYLDSEIVRNIYVCENVFNIANNNFNICFIFYIYIYIYIWCLLL